MENSPFQETVSQLNALRNFLRTAPSQFGPGDRIRHHELPNSDIISCVKWDDDFFISGTDILRCIIYRFQALGREVIKRAKFEEFVFSDLRSLKTNVRVRLEEGKSDLLVFLHDNGCIRTKKKQRVFYWDAVPHDQLFLDTLERELRRAVIDFKNEEQRVSVAVREPALSMKFDPLHKVGYQIENIMTTTPYDQKEIVAAVFGVTVPGYSNALLMHTDQAVALPISGQVHHQPVHFPLHRALIGHRMDHGYIVPYGVAYPMQPTTVQLQAQQNESHQHRLQTQLLQEHSAQAQQQAQAQQAQVHQQAQAQQQAQVQQQAQAQQQVHAQQQARSQPVSRDPLSIQGSQIIQQGSTPVPTVVHSVPPQVPTPLPNIPRVPASEPPQSVSLTEMANNSVTANENISTQSDENSRKAKSSSLPPIPNGASSSMPTLPDVKELQEHLTTKNSPNTQSSDSEVRTQSDPGYSLEHYSQNLPENRTSSLQNIKADSLRDSGDKSITLDAPQKYKMRRNVRLPPIKDALPMHAQFDLSSLTNSATSKAEPSRVVKDEPEVKETNIKKKFDPK